MSALPVATSRIEMNLVIRNSRRRPPQVERPLDTLTRALIEGTAGWLSDKECPRLQRHWAKKVTAEQDKMARLLAQGRKRSAKKEADRLRCSASAGLHALDRTRPRHLRPSSTATGPERAALQRRAMNQLASKLEQVRELSIPASPTLKVIEKRRDWQPGQRRRGNIEYRVVGSFGWVDRARQRVLSLSLTPFADLHPSQYLLRQGPGRRGRLGVCEDLRRLAPALGADMVFLQIDVRNYYGSIDHGWLERHLGLPANVVRAQVHYGGMCLTTGAGMSAHVHRLDGARQEMARRESCQVNSMGFY